jgi:hypothetical protein
MRLRNDNLGIASQAGQLLRAGLGSILSAAEDRQVYRRFGGRIAQWLGTQKADGMAGGQVVLPLEGFDFNPETSFAERCKIPFEVTALQPGKILLGMPGFVPVIKIAAPAGCSSVDLNFAVSTCHLPTRSNPTSATYTLTLPYNSELQPPAEIILEAGTVPGTLLIVAARITYRLNSGEKESRPVFMPAGVVKAMYL